MHLNGIQTCELSSRTLRTDGSLLVRLKLVHTYLGFQEPLGSRKDLGIDLIGDENTMETRGGRSGLAEEGCMGDLLNRSAHFLKNR